MYALTVKAQCVCEKNDSKIAKFSLTIVMN